MIRSSSARSRSWHPRSWATAALRGGGHDSANRHLLEAMKPYLAEKRRRKIDRAMKLARLASLAELAAEDLEGDDHV